MMDPAEEDPSSILSDATILAGTALASLQLVTSTVIPRRRLGEEDLDLSIDHNHYSCEDTARDHCLNLLIDLISKITKASKRIKDQQHGHDKLYRKYRSTMEILRGLRDENTRLRELRESEEDKKREHSSQPMQRITELEQRLQLTRTEKEYLQNQVKTYLEEKEQYSLDISELRQELESSRQLQIQLKNNLDRSEKSRVKLKRILKQTSIVMERQEQVRLNSE